MDTGGNVVYMYFKLHHLKSYLYYISTREQIERTIHHIISIEIRRNSLNHIPGRLLQCRNKRQLSQDKFLGFETRA